MSQPQAMVSGPPSPPKEKAILIQAQMEDQSVWFIIKDTAEGPQLCKIFENIPQDEPDIFSTGSSCAVIGSTLYVIGGQDNSDSFWPNLSNRVRRLDLQNPADGWKTTKTSFCCFSATATVAGNLIYLLPQSSPFKPEHTEYKYPYHPWFLVYDPNKQKFDSIEPPPGGRMSGPTFCLPFEGGGVVLPILQDKKECFYVYEKSWKPLKDYSPFHRKPFVPYAVSNGILYLLDDSEEYVSLCGHDISSGNLLFKIQLPPLDSLDLRCSSIYLVPIDDYKLFFMWEIHTNFEKFSLGYAKLLVSLVPSPTIFLLDEGWFDVDMGVDVKILNCLPLDSYPNQGKERAIPIALRLASSKFKKVLELTEEVDWKRCIENLMAEVEGGGEFFQKTA